MSYDNEPNVGAIFVGICLFLFGCALVGVPLWYLRAASSVVTAPARVIDRTMDTNNILDSYEDFRDTFQAFNARTAQIREFKNEKPISVDDQEHLRIELAGQRQSCREIAARYNSQSSKANHKIFKFGGGELPDRLDMAECDA